MFMKQISIETIKSQHFGSHVLKQIVVYDIATTNLDMKGISKN